MQKITLALSVAFVFVCTMAVAPHAAPADRRVELSVVKDGAPLAGVEVAVYAAKEGRVDLGMTGHDGSIGFAINAANIGKVRVAVVVEECPNGTSVLLVAPGGLPPEQDKCTRLEVGAFQWESVKRVVINVAGGVSVTRTGLSGAVIGGLVGGGAVVGAAVAAGGGGGSSAPAPSSTPVATAPPPTPPPPAPPPDASRFIGPPPFNTTSTVTSFTDPKCSREVGFSFTNPGQFAANPDGTNCKYDKGGFDIGPPGTINPATGAFSISMAGPRPINFPGLPPMQQVTMQFNGNFAQDGRSFEGTLTVNINAGPAPDCNGQRQILNVRGSR